MQLFPRRNPEEKAREVMDWVWITGVFLVLAAVGLGLFFFGGSQTPPASGTTWDAVRWIGLLVGAIAAYLCAQAALSLLVEATIGPERYIAAVMVMIVIFGLYVWLV